MHSPGGIPSSSNIDTAYMWEDNISGEREWADSTDPFYLGQLAAAGLSLTAIGALYRAGVIGGAARTLFVASQRPINWALYNAYREYGDIKHWMAGGDFEIGHSWTVRPFNPMGLYQYPLLVPFPWFDVKPKLVEGSSSKTYQQNGGPSAPLVQKGKGSRPVTLPAAKPSAHGGGGSGAKPRRKRCPSGHRWNGSRCVRIRS